jgi:hypothetical protein
MTSWYNSINHSIDFMQSWCKLASRTADIMYFSPHVIEARTRHFSDISRQPDWSEFYAMYAEKYKAMLHSATVWNQFIVSPKDHNNMGVLRMMNAIALPYAQKTKSNARRLK